MDPGHYNCRDYYVSPHFAPLTITNEPRPPPFRHESFDELQSRCSSPASKRPKFPLLRLPLELRQQIFGYLLPRTLERRESNRTSNHARNSAVSISNVVWQRGTISLLRVCKQLHGECAEALYGNNTFLISVTYAGVTFRYRYLLPRGMAPTRTYNILELLSERYQRLIKRIVVNVDHVDSYTSMIKFNVSGSGFTHGLRRQVSRLVKALKAAEQLGEERQLAKVVVRVSNANAVLEAIKSDFIRQREGAFSVADDLEEILAPFAQLRGVRDVSVGGAVADGFARELEDRMRSTERSPDQPRQYNGPDDGLASDSTDIHLCVYGNDL